MCWLGAYGRRAHTRARTLAGSTPHGNALPPLLGAPAGDSCAASVPLGQFTCSCVCGMCARQHNIPPCGRIGNHCLLGSASPRRLAAEIAWACMRVRVSFVCVGGPVGARMVRAAYAWASVGTCVMCGYMRCLWLRGGAVVCAGLGMCGRVGVGVCGRARPSCVPPPAPSVGNCAPPLNRCASVRITVRV